MKAVSVLVGGTAFAQILGVATLPIITRLYNPNEFGLFAMYTSILAVITVVGCLRYEIAIPIPKSDDTALSLVKVSMISLILVVLTIILILSVLYYLGEGYFQQWYWLIPLSVFLTCIFNILQYWYIRKKNFKYIASTKIQQSSIVAFTQIVAGFAQVGGGLIIGSLLGIVFSFIKNINKFSSEKNSLFKISSKKEAIEYRKFPLISTFESLFNTGSVYLPLILIGIYLEKESVALVFLAIKVLAIPISLVGSAISQVYLSHAADVAREAKLKAFTNNIIKKLSLFMAFPFIVITFLVPQVSGWVFGENWKGVGDLIVLMLPWFYFQLISSPVSFSLQVTGNQRAALFLQIFGFIVRFFGVYLFCIFDFLDQVVAYYAISGFLFYLTYLLVIQFFIRKSDYLVGINNAIGK
nr:oligosaccharide flippase family protein [Acinetobacter sp. YH12075]